MKSAVAQRRVARLTPTMASNASTGKKMLVQEGGDDADEQRRHELRDELVQQAAGAGPTTESPAVS